MMAIDFSTITFEQLNQEHPDRIFWKQEWLNYRLLYLGGAEMLRAAGQNSITRAGTGGGGVATTGSSVIDQLADKKRRRRFLYQLEGENDTKYISRWERAYYVPYLGAAIDYFDHWLFSQPPVIRPKEADVDPPDWLTDFLDDADGAGTRFHDVSKDRFRDQLIVQRAGWLIGTPDTKVPVVGDAVEGVPVLTPYAAEDILDWQEDASGELNWILIKKCREVRDFPNERRSVEVRIYVDRNQWAAWEVAGDKQEKTASLLGSGDHGLKEVPFIWQKIPEGLWPANKLASWQISIFNQMSMLDYGQLVSCFLQPFILTAEAGATNRIFGEGNLIELKPSMGDRGAEDFGWKVPDIAPLEYSGKRIAEVRDEGFRVIHQMSLAVDAQTAVTVARSAASKQEDRRATEVILCAYGQYERAMEIKTLNLIGRIMGDNTEFVVDGYDNFEVSSIEEEMQTAALLSTVSIKSPTFVKETQKSFATGRILARASEQVKEKIREEIDDAVDAEEEQKLAPQAPLGTPVEQEPGVPPAPPVVNPPAPPGPKSDGKPTPPTKEAA